MVFVLFLMLSTGLIQASMQDKENWENDEVYALHGLAGDFNEQPAAPGRAQPAGRQENEAPRGPGLWARWFGSAQELPDKEEEEAGVVVLPAVIAAVRAGKPDLVQSLVSKHKPDVNADLGDGVTLLTIAQKLASEESKKMAAKQAVLSEQGQFKRASPDEQARKLAVYTTKRMTPYKQVLNILQAANKNAK